MSDVPARYRNFRNINRGQSVLSSLNVWRGRREYNEADSATLSKTRYAGSALLASPARARELLAIQAIGLGNHDQLALG